MANTKQGRATRIRKGWKIGTAKRADGTTGANACVCGCGTMVRGLFAQGHDARVHGMLLKVEREEMTASKLPATVQRALANGQIRHRERSGRVIGEKKAIKAATKAGQTKAAQAA